MPAAFRILAPVRSLAEVEAGARAGADEFYAGVLTPERTNLRAQDGYHNFPCLADFGAAAKRAHELGKKMFLALNAKWFRSETFDGLASAILATGADALIVANLGLAARLAAERFPIPVHVSTLASFANAATVRAAAKALPNARRFCLERATLSYDTLRALACAPLPMELEFFVFSGGCMYHESLCGLHKRPGEKTSHDCGRNRAPKPVTVSGRDPSLPPPPALSTDKSPCFDVLSVDPAFAKLELTNILERCSLCAIGRLAREEGFRGASLKIEGRGDDPEYKFRVVTAVRAAVNLASEGLLADRDARAAYRLAAEYACAPGKSCYFHVPHAA